MTTEQAQMAEGERALTLEEETAAADELLRPFSELLFSQRRGLFHEEATEKLNALVRAVQETGKGGTLTIAVAIKPAGRNAALVIVRDEVKAKLPEPEKGDGLYYVDRHGNLVRDDPNQPGLPFGVKELPAQQRRVKELGQ